MSRRWLPGLLLALLVAAPAIADEVELRSWHFGLQGVRGGRDGFDVFGRDDLNLGEVEESGRGGGFFLGRRFGDRFLLDLQVATTRHGLDGEADRVLVVDGLVTGTVLFHERATFQPFVRGGFGGGITVFEFPDDGGNVAALGMAAIAGGGFQLRASSRISFEFEGVATFTNFLEAQDERDGAIERDWQVRVSQVGWRVGTGVVFWF